MYEPTWIVEAKNEMKTLIRDHKKESKFIDRAIREFIDYVGEEKLIGAIAEEVLRDGNVRSNTDNKRLLRIREILRDNGYSIPFKQYRKDNEI